MLPRTTVRSGVALSANNRSSNNNNKTNWIFELWDELIEFSTYGPAERKILKARRMAQQEQNEQQKIDSGRVGGGNGSTSSSALGSSSLEDSFRQRVEKIEQKQKRDEMTAAEPSNIVIGGKTSSSNNDDDSEESQLSVHAFRKAAAVTAVSSKANDEDEDIIDGYQLRDIIVSRFGVPLDVDFQRGFLPSSVLSQTGQQQREPLPCVYCTVLPYVGFGSRTRSRHLSELDYLMHLQAVVEILHKYDNLDAFILWLETTKKVPKPGTESLPFRMKLDDQQLRKVLGVTQ